MTKRYNDGVAFGSKGEKEIPGKGNPRGVVRGREGETEKEIPWLPGWVL